MESSVLSAKSMDSSCLSEELSELSSSRLSYPVRDADQLSVSSSSSMGGPSISPRDRFLPMDRGETGNYMPMSGRSSNNSQVKVSVSVSTILYICMHFLYYIFLFKL